MPKSVIKPLIPFKIKAFIRTHTTSRDIQVDPKLIADMSHFYHEHGCISVEDSGSEISERRVGTVQYYVQHTIAFYELNS